MDTEERRRIIGCRGKAARSGDAAGQGGAVAAEGEHGQRDQRLGGAESERNPGQESDLGVRSGAAVTAGDYAGLIHGTRMRRRASTAKGERDWPGLVGTRGCIAFRRSRAR